MQFKRENVITSHSLHDKTAKCAYTKGEDLIFSMEDDCNAGEKNLSSVIFRDIDPDFCFVYVLCGFTKNTGKFRGEKFFLSDFIRKYPSFRFEIIDADYGYNHTKLSGWLYGKAASEITFEIYHAGDMFFEDNL